MARKNTKRASRKAPKGIAAIVVQGYKSLHDETRLEIRPLTVLAGANSSGKSSAMEPLLLLKQTLEASYDPGPLLLDGPNVKLSSTRQALCRLSGKRRVSQFSVAIEDEGGSSMKLTFSSERGRRLLLREMTWSTQAHDTNLLRPGMSTDEVLAANPALAERPTFSSVRFTQKLTPCSREVAACTVERTRCFLTASMELTDRSEGGTEVHLGRRHSRPAILETDIRGVIHVPGLRGNPLRTYPTTGTGPAFPGTFENYVATVVAAWQARGGRELKALWTALERLGLTWKVDAKPIDETRVELRVGRLPHAASGGARDLVNIADVGFGVSQALPVVVALLAAQPGELVYIEQPELHLHPRAQTALARILADAAERGVRVVAETHSSILLLAVQTLVAEGKVPPDLVKLHWFERGRDGATKVTSADLDETGAFGDWPEDFGGVELKAESRYLDAAEQRRGGR